MKLVVGLGNPGSQYRDTRHNLGFMVIDELARRQDMDLGREKFHAWFAVGQIAAQKVALAKPTTFVNRSGQAVVAITNFYQLAYEDLLVVVDDMALPLGKLRLRAHGSPGGHNGLRDIAQRLGSQQWARLRIGIGTAEYDATRHVLGRISDADQPVVHSAIGRAADAVTCWVDRGITTAMNIYNPAAPTHSSDSGGESDQEAH